jgi:hypothetical protein
MNYINLSELQNGISPEVIRESKKKVLVSGWQVIWV